MTHPIGFKELKYASLFYAYPLNESNFQNHYKLFMYKLYPPIYSSLVIHIK